MNELNGLSEEHDTELKGHITSLQEKKKNLENQSSLINTAKSKLENLKNTIPDVISQDYRNKVQEYNQQVDEYNKLVDSYGTFIGEYNHLIRQYNKRKDELLAQTTGTTDWGNLDSSMAFGQFYNTDKLDHLDVKFSAANAMEKDSNGNLISAANKGNYTVSGVYTSKEAFEADPNKYGLTYRKNSSAPDQVLSLDKGTYEFTVINGTNLHLDKDQTTVSFYIVLENEKREKNGFTVTLDSSIVYPEGTYYCGNKAYSLKGFKDKNGREIPSIIKDGKTYYDISGLSVFAVSAMTCDRFFWDKAEAEYYNHEHNIKTGTERDRLNSDGTLKKPNGLDLVLNLDTLISIVQREKLTSLKYIETSNLSAVTGIAQKATTVGTVQAPLTEIHNQQGGLPQTGLNRMGVLGLALAGFSSLATGLGLEISDRRKKHHKC